MQGCWDALMPSSACDITMLLSKATIRPERKRRQALKSKANLPHGKNTDGRR